MYQGLSPGIEVAKFEKVTHPDCTLCMDCVEACNTQNAIQVSTAKSKWVPPVVTVALVVLAFIIGKNYHLTTISERWGAYDTIENIGVFEMEGLKSVKCFGSAKSLQNQLMRKKGIVGLDAWADVNKVKVYYDADQMDDDDIRETIFKPAKYKVSTMKSDPPRELTVFEVPVEGVFDAYDNAHLVRMFRQSGGICGMATSYGEPVLVAILFDADQTSVEKIKTTIEQGEYTLKKGDKEEVVEVDFECATAGEITGTVKYSDFLKDYFSGYSRFFNEFKKYEDEQVGIYEIGFPKAEVSTIRRKLGYLSSHLSFNDNIIGIKTVYTEKPVLRVYFVKDSVTEKTIDELLTVEMLQYLSKDGEKETENIFEFEGDAKILDYEK